MIRTHVISCKLARARADALNLESGRVYTGVLVAHWRTVRKKTMRRHEAKNADYRGGVTCLCDTQLLAACLHASECGGRYRPEAVRGMPEVPVAPPSHGTAAVGFCQPSLFQQAVVGAFA